MKITYNLRPIAEEFFSLIYGRPPRKPDVMTPQDKTNWSAHEDRALTQERIEDIWIWNDPASSQDK